VTERVFNRVHGGARGYEVFARKLRTEPLKLIGSVVAPDDDLAAAYARATYDEERWIEMAIVPRSSITTLWAPGEEGD
jgi:1,2-phenylacetyl-CoA epoxidase PaaB subunit